MFSSDTTQVSDGGYQISRSLRFNSADSANLSFTPSTTTNRRTFTFSAWVKLSKTSDDPFLMGAGAGGQIWFVGDKIRVRLNGSPDYYYDTAAVFRDYSAWYHIVVGVDTTNATSTDRVKIYVNSTQQTIGASAAPPQNYDTEFNLASTNNRIGQWPSGGQYLNGYMTEVNFIDGQALTPSSFGETNAQTGVWQPKAYSGSYGTNGFYLNFSDNSNTTAATLGKDYSGNGNNWTPNNFSVTAGAGNDSMVDVPTPYGVDTGAGGSVRGNYCTFNPLDKNSSLVVTNGNLDVTDSTGGWINGRCTIGMSSGKWYFESTVTSGPYQVVGIANSLTISTGYQGGSVVGNWAYSADGAKILDGVYSPPYGASFTTNDVIGIAFDADTGTLTMYKNGTSQGTLVSGLPANTYFPWVATLSSTVSFNFGQRPFAYTAPSGFKALCTQNLPTPTIGATTATLANKYFDVVLRTGAGGGTYSTTVNMANGALLWDKPRNQASSNYLVDSVRGISNHLRSNQTGPEVADTTWYTAFNNGSYTTGASDWGSPTTIVDWIWAAGAGTSNTAGSITSTVGASATSGFSIVTYTGTGANATIGHGLGAVPSMIIVKCRNAAGDIWDVYHVSIGNTQYLRLNGPNPAGTYNSWQNTTPTSTVFYISTDTVVNTNGNTYVAYCFAPIAGYSAFGSYTGNASTDGPFVFTGMRPAYIMLKRTDNTSDWFVYDATRSPYNAASTRLYPDLSVAEDTGGSNYDIDFLSNGFKLRGTGQINISGSTWIFMAFASNPFKYSLAR